MGPTKPFSTGARNCIGKGAGRLGARYLGTRYLD